MGKIFEIEILMINALWLIKKIEKIVIVNFGPMNPNFREMAMSTEKNHNGIFFEIEYFILKYVLDHFESIPIDKKRKKISTYEPHFPKQQWSYLKVERIQRNHKNLGLCQRKLQNEKISIR